MTLQHYEYILHPGIFDVIRRGEEMCDLLEASARRSALEVSEIQGPHPDISLVIRTRNDAETLPALFKDIDSQDSGGELQVIIADSESADRTVDVAKAEGRNYGLGVTVVSIAQKGF